MEIYPLRQNRIVAISALLVTYQMVMGSIVFNGGLEMLPEESETVRTILPGESYAGWASVGNGDIEFVTVFTPAAEGMASVDLNGIAYEGAIAQVLRTEPGTLYRVRFALSGNPGLPGQMKFADKTMTVSWGGSEVGSFVFKHRPDDTWTNMRWEYHQVLVEGTGDDELRFTSTTATYHDAGPVIDDIIVMATPDPQVSIVVSQVAVCWESQDGFSYQLEYISALTDGAWIPLGDELAGDGTVLCVNDLVSRGAPRKFYRVRIQ
jgi:hypothetical protein